MDVFKGASSFVVSLTGSYSYSVSNNNSNIFNNILSINKDMLSEKKKMISINKNIIKEEDGYSIQKMTEFCYITQANS